MRKHILLIALLSISSALAAQQTVTLESSRRMALENNKKVKIAAETTRKAEYTVKQYKANFLPSIKASGLFLSVPSKSELKIDGGYLPTYIFDPVSGQMQPNLFLNGGNPVIGPDGNPIFNEYAFLPDIPLQFKIGNFYMAAVSLEQPVYMGGKIKSAYRMSLIGKEMAKVNEDLTNTEIILKSDEAYWNCVRAAEMVKALEKYKEVVEELYRVVSNAVNVGMKQKGDQLRVQVARNQATLDLRKAKNASTLAMMNLCYVIGLPMDTDLKIEGDLSESSNVLLTDDYSLADRPDYQILSSQIELKAQEEKLTRSDFLPNVAVMANYGYANGLKLNDSKLVDRTAPSLMAMVTIPVFHWGEGRNKVAVARSDRKLAELQRSDYADQMMLEIAMASNKLSEATLEVELTTSALAAAQENLRMSDDRFEVGLVTLADHLEAQTLWQKAWAEKINAEANLRLEESAYLKAIGKL